MRIQLVPGHFSPPCDLGTTLSLYEAISVIRQSERIIHYHEFELLKLQTIQIRLVNFKMLSGLTEIIIVSGCIVRSDAVTFRQDSKHDQSSHI